jgi:hypothetical protein
MGRIPKNDWSSEGRSYKKKNPSRGDYGARRGTAFSLLLIAFFVGCAYQSPSTVSPAGRAAFQAPAPPRVTSVPPPSHSRTAQAPRAKNEETVSQHSSVVYASEGIKLSQRKGVLVVRVTPDGPAAKAGVVKGDILLELAGREITSGAALAKMLTVTPPGTEARLRIASDGESRTVSVTLGLSPRETDDDRSWLGVALEQITIKEVVPTGDQARGHGRMEEDTFPRSASPFTRAASPQHSTAPASSNSLQIRPTSILSEVAANTNLGEKKIRNIQNELEQLTHAKDVNDPAVRARVEELLAAHQAEQERMEKLADMAQRTLGEENPARVAATQEVIASLAKTKDMADYVNQMIKDRGEKLTQTPADQSEKEGWGNGQVVDLPPEKSSGHKKDDSVKTNGVEKQVKTALHACDFRGAKGLLDQLEAGEDKTALEGAYETARSGEEQARAGVEEAKSLSKSGDYDGALAALNEARASARCDKTLARIDKGIGIVQGKQEQKTVAATECWPNSEPYRDKAANAVRCRCLSGYRWNSEQTSCVPDRQMLVAKTDCSHIPHSAPAWDSEADRPGCFCQRGYEWDGESCVNLAQREREQDEANQRAAADLVGALGNLQNALSGRSASGGFQSGHERRQLQPTSPLNQPILSQGGSEVAQECYRLFQQGNQTGDDETLAALYSQWQQLGCDSHMATFTSPQCASLFQEIEQTEDGDTLAALSSQWRQLGCENP